MPWPPPRSCKPFWSRKREVEPCRPIGNCFLTTERKRRGQTAVGANHDSPIQTWEDEGDGEPQTPS
jgi:hypothetical protein